MNNVVDLYVSHGIFSRGLEELTKVFDTIYTTNSFYQGSTEEKVKVKDLREYIEKEGV